MLTATVLEPQSTIEAAALLGELAASEVPVAIAGSVLPSDDGSGIQRLEGIAVTLDEPSSKVAWIGNAALADDDVRSALAVLTAVDGPGVVAHDAKPLIAALNEIEVDLGGLRLDTSLAGLSARPVGQLVPPRRTARHLHRFRLPDDEGPPDGQLDFGDQQVAESERTARTALAASRLGQRLAVALEEDGLTELNDTIEVPLVRVLARMEYLGVGVDRAELESLNADMTAEAEALAKQIQEDAEEEFNVNSTKKLREILFEKLELTPQKKTKTGYSTDQATLEKLVGEHPIIEHLLAYREVEKLRSTYGAVAPRVGGSR